MGKIIVAGIGPGSQQDITPAVLEAVREADVIVGYQYYFQFIMPYVKAGCECIDTGMKKERQRAEQAFELAEQGKTVVVISSGDAGIYGMTPLIYEMRRERGSDIEIASLPGISAFQKAASLLGAPIGHDMCIISMSDLMTPWEVIERRIVAAAVGDFVTAVYNPKSHGRYWQLYRLQEIFLQHRSPETPVGYVRQAGRDDEVVKLTTLSAFDPEDVDMFTVIIIGNSQSYISLTPNPIPADAPARPLVACKARTRSLSDTLHSILDDVDEHLLEKDGIEMNGYGFVGQTEVNMDVRLRTQVFEEGAAGFHLFAEVAELQLRLRNLYYFGKAGYKGREGGEPLGFVASETAYDARHTVVHLVSNHTDDALIGGFLSKTYF